MTHEIDHQWLRDTLLTLLATDTGVPDGETEVLPGDPMITRAVEHVILPIVEGLEPEEIRRHPDGDLAARFGPPGDAGLLLQTYVVSQHGNLMTDRDSARIVDGAELGLTGPAAVGQGANQNKGPMSAALAALRMDVSRLKQPVWLTANTEGRSSHGGSRRILDDLKVRAAFGITSIGTDLRVSIGNRGRVDVLVHLPGRSCHSSQPWLGDNPIERAADVVRALRDAPTGPAHPELGKATLTPYQLRFHPVAPHTIPAEGTVVVDRRILPGERVTDAVEAVRSHLVDHTNLEVDVEEGASMLPAVIAEDALLVTELCAGVAAAGGTAGTMWSLNTFDAGYACAIGIPTCMFGPGRRSFGDGVTATEAVGLEDCGIAAAALSRAIRSVCG